MDINLTQEDLRIQSLGKASHRSPLYDGLPSGWEEGRFISDETRIHYHITEGDGEELYFERAGARANIFFEPGRTRAAVVTCGGLCPGLNDVIRSIVMSLEHWYEVKEILGVKYGYAGLRDGGDFVPLTAEGVSDIHKHGGSVLGSSRGHVPASESVDTLVKAQVDILFCIGGDGTLRGAHAIAEEVTKRGLPISIIGIPKTIDNDIPLVYRSFGFDTAVAEACRVLDCAHMEAKGAPNGVGLVKLMGRNAGFIAANATRASGDVNFCLVPEVAFPLEGEGGLLEMLLDRLRRRKHAVIAVAEGAGQHLIGVSDQRDASGNIVYKDIGLFLKERIQDAFKKWGETVNVKYFDPSYIIRSVPASAQDSIFCADLGRHAVNAAMAGKTSMLIAYWHGVFTNVPLAAIQKNHKQLDPRHGGWLSVLATTGQPAGWGFE